MENKQNVAEHKRRNRDMFNAIARRYDLLNHLLSGGVDVYWRRRALQAAQDKRPQRVLDLATGTGDFALAADRLGPQQVVGIDMAIEMLRLGAAKVAAKGSSARVELLVGDAEQLPFQDHTFDMVTGAFGVRNFGNIPSGLVRGASGAQARWPTLGARLLRAYCAAVPAIVPVLLPQSAALNRRPNLRPAPGLRLSAALGGDLSPRAGLCRIARRGRVQSDALHAYDSRDCRGISGRQRAG